MAAIKRFSPAWFLHHGRNNALVRWLHEDRTLHLVGVPLRAEPVAPPPPDDFRVNARDDLDRFEPTERWHDRAAFLAGAEDSLAEGKLCVTRVIDGQLAFIAWIRPEQDQARFGSVGHTVRFPPHTATHFSVYVHPGHRRKGLFVAGLKAVISVATHHTETRLLLGAVEGGNTPALKGHLAAGFRPVATLTTRTSLGRRRFGADRSADGLAWPLTPAGPGVWDLTAEDDR
ncbi:MAG: GNAT family N-acetyltransferase [Rhodobacterales bacterium]|nr:GNAT family N-acetyltransferase [Rhodobacterales bacterium]